MKDLTSELLTAFLAAPMDRKERALQTLCGEILPETHNPFIAPMLLGMAASAKLLGVSRPTLWRMIRDGRIPKIEILPGSYRLSRADLEAFAKGELKPSVSRGGR